ncbi:protease [Xanthobacter sp. KR7-65]|uniref:protease n=1 Tax=Xanthobacter sp. KR7-65 TaxID=3156612 RepID=UPI0032B5AD13
MIELLLILYGTETTRRRWWVLALAGAVWFALGAFFFANALIDEYRINPIYFAIPLAIDGAAALLGGLGITGAGRALRFSKAAMFFALALIVLVTAGRADMVVGIAAGVFLVGDACWRAGTVYLVRFEGWHRAMLIAAFEFVIGIWFISPWPTHWRGSIGVDVGMLLMLSAVNTIAFAIRLARLPPGVPFSKAVREGLLDPGAAERSPDAVDAVSPILTDESKARRGSVIVHVWTPTGAIARVDHAISRYIAAHDSSGTISTGHAALEMADIYISHYPAVEIERSPEDFRRVLRATHDNDVAGRFLPSHAEEVADWCEPTMNVQISGIDEAALRRFWQHYSRNTTYNLTSRNCSSTVAAALDAGLEGIFAPYARSPYFLLRLCFSPELLVATRMRRRAASMAWTPGLVLDYARALSYIVTLPERLHLKTPERPSGELAIR